jgi:hypothetical protein
MTRAKVCERLVLLSAVISEAVGAGRIRFKGKAVPATTPSQVSE